MSGFVTVYDQSGQMLGVLGNAMDIGYSLRRNDLSTATFALPVDDPDNALCQAHNYITLPEPTRDIGMYRIIGMPSSDEIAQGGKKVYNLEHVIATLVDDPLFGYHEIGGLGIYTQDVIRYILDRQTIKRWQLGVCEFNDQFPYKFENVTLLTALLSLGEVLIDEYTWVFDTNTTPWTIHLRRADSEPGCGIHYMRNMTGIQKSWDASTLVTRLLLLGYGEGVNQLTIADVNNGKYYVEADTVSKWGIKTSIFVDTRIEDPHTLKARGQAVVNGLKDPYVSYTATAIDLARITGYSWDNFMPGKLVWVNDREHGTDFTARIISIDKPNLRGRDGEITITIANAIRDVTASINTLANRMGIHELYSQGATNLQPLQYADNADPAHPLRMRMYIPRECVRINKFLLSWRIEAFRAYETGAAAGGGTTTSSSSGGGQTATSSSGGGQTKTSSASGATSVTEDSRVVSLEKSTGNAMQDGYAMNYTQMELTAVTSGAEGSTALASGGSTGEASGSTLGPNYSNTTGPNYASSGTNSTAYTSYNAHLESGTHRHTLGDHTHSLNSHTHGLNSHTHGMGPHYHTQAQHSHGLNYHTHIVPAHQHGVVHYHMFNHSHTIPGHTHTIAGHSHEITIDSHSHTVPVEAHSHSLTTPDHVHQILYGIYEGGQASNMTIRVDGSTVPADSVSSNEMNIIQWLSKNEYGKIIRGTWHTVEIIPDGLTRIEANLFVQTFIQSVGGGDY